MVKKKQCEFKDEDSSTESNDDARVRNSGTAGGFGPGTGGDACVHVKNSIHSQTVRKRVKSAGGLDLDCAKCAEAKAAGRAPQGPEPLVSDLLDYESEPDPSLWMCLRCGSQLCGRSVNQHALEHYKTPRSESHALCINTTRLQVWCYACDQEVNPKAVPRLADMVDFVRAEAKVAAMKAVTSDPAGGSVPRIDNLDEKIASAVNTIQTLGGNACGGGVGGDGDGSSVTNSTMVYGPKQNNVAPNYRDIRLDIGGGSGTGRKLPAIVSTSSLSIVDSLPRLRGLSNLGNTCFFNAVVQCLTRTPYLLDVLRESSVQGEKFQLPGGPLKLKDGTVTDLSPISGELNSWGPFTQVLADTLSELQSGGGVFSPSKLFSQLTNKWPQFAGMDQHDSHELLRHLLESVRSEDLRRYQLVILLSLGYGKRVDPNTVEDTMKEKIKFYGAQASDRILGPEPVFRGFLVSTLTCQDCYHVSARHESFLDLSLPINSEKPQPPIRRKGSPEPDYGYSASTSGGATPKPLSNRERRRIKKVAKKQEKAERLQQSNAAGGDSTAADAPAEGTTADDSDKDDDGMSDADVEDNLTDDSQPKKMDQNGNQSAAAAGGPEKRDDAPENPNKEGEGNVVCELGLSAEGVANMMEKMSIHGEQQEAKNKARRQRTISHADWGNTLAPRYQCEDNECSIQSCLNAFTAVELMAGNNKVCCDACTERINGKDGKSVNTNATKQFLISSPPAVLILHLKRFQVGPRGMFRKMTKTVTFPFVLDIAPFCGSRVKKLPTVRPGQKKLLYSLYGIVEHSGTMHGGHYVAYVKVRPQLTKDDPRWTFLPKGSKAELDQKDEEAIQLEKELAREQARGMTAAAAARDSDDALTSSSSTSSSRSSTGTTSDGEECEGAVGYTPKPELLPDVDPPPGKWYYVSDSHVRETTEDSVLNAQAYLLFYERIF